MRARWNISNKRLQKCHEFVLLRLQMQANRLFVFNPPLCHPRFTPSTRWLRTCSRFSAILETVKQRAVSAALGAWRPMEELRA